LVEQQTEMASLLKKGGAGKSLPGECTEDAAKAVQGAIAQLAEKYGVDLDENAKAAWKEEEKKSELKGSVQERYEQAAMDFRKKEQEDAKNSNKGSGKFITQETFDSVVQENIEDFEMEPDEAAADAILQFESQGVDLSNIVKTSGGANSGPVPGILNALEEASTVEEAVTLMKDLSKAVEVSEDDYMIAQSKDANGSIFGAVGRIDKDSVPLVKHALLCFATLQKFPITKASDVVPLYPLAKPVLRMVFESKKLKDIELWSIACKVARWSCTKNENTKESLFNTYGFNGHIRTALRVGLGWSEEDVKKTGLSHEAVSAVPDEPNLPLLKEALLFLAIMLVDDDRRTGITPGTFGRGRMMGKWKNNLFILSIFLVGKLILIFFFPVFFCF
jgi:hypothetical protein